MRQLEQNFFVSGQIRPEEVTSLAAQGIRTLINNRPDGEAPGQPNSEAIRRAAEEAGLAYAEIPVSRLTQDAVEKTRRVLADTEAPILAFCASGTRSTFLWALARAGSLGGDDITARAAAAGYDLAPIRHYLG